MPVLYCFVQERKVFRARPLGAYVSYPVLRRYLLELSVPPKPPPKGEKQESKRLRTSLYFLGLLGEDGSPTLALEQMARAEPSDRLQLLASALTTHYEWLSNAPVPQTYDDFVTTLRQQSGLHGDAFARAERFLLAAVRDLNISLPFDSRRRRSTPHQATPPMASDQHNGWDPAKARGRYFKFLMSVVEHQRAGDIPDPVLLDRIERCIGL